MGFSTDFNPEYDFGRAAIVKAGKGEAESRATSDYPYAVFRDSQGAVQEADRAFKVWLGQKWGSSTPPDKNEWYIAHESDIKRLFTSTFANVYLEKVAEQDKKNGRSSAVQPATLATLQGATVVLKGVDRSKANEYVYSLELSDPEYFDGVEKTEWVVYFEGASVPATEAATATAAYGMASMSDVGYSYGSATPQKTARKPKGSYLRRPQ